MLMRGAHSLTRAHALPTAQTSPLNLPTRSMGCTRRSRAPTMPINRQGLAGIAGHDVVGGVPLIYAGCRHA